MNPRVNEALRKFAASATNCRLCKCGCPLDGIGNLCSVCIAKEPVPVASMLMATLATSIREKEKSFEHLTQALNYEAASLASLRRVFDQIAIFVHHEAEEERARREKAPDSGRVSKSTEA